MSEVIFTPEIFEQKELVRKECLKLQALIDDKMLDTTSREKNKSNRKF
jgi:hypothetical protein